MTDRTAQGWAYPGAPGSSQEKAFIRRYIVTITVDNRSFTVHRDVAAIFKAFLEELVHKYNYSIDEVMDDWGWANRSVRGQTNLSNHAYGLAIDVNATKNGLTYESPPPNDLPANISYIAEKYGLFWGGDYRNRKDPMHFEFLGSPDDARRITSQLLTMEEDVKEWLFRDPRDGREWYCIGFMFKRYVDDPAELAHLQSRVPYDQQVPTQTFDSMRNMSVGDIDG